MTDERITQLWAEAFRGPEASGIRFARLVAAETARECAELAIRCLPVRQRQALSIEIRDAIRRKYEKGNAQANRSTPPSTKPSEVLGWLGTHNNYTQVVRPCEEIYGPWICMGCGKPHELGTPCPEVTNG